MPIRVARTFTVPVSAPAVLDHLAARNGHGRHLRSRVLGLRIELTYLLRERGPDRLVFAGHDEGATSTGTITVRPIEGGAEVTFHLEREMHGVAKLATPLAKLEFEKLGNEVVARLTAALSGLAAPEPEGQAR
jgi:hypothetical protein